MYTFIQKFTYQIPLKFLELIFFPVSYFLILSFYNITIGKAYDIIVMCILLILFLFYYFLTIYLMNTTFFTYIKPQFIKYYGSLYFHMNFINLDKHLQQNDGLPLKKLILYTVARNYINIKKWLNFIIAFIAIYQ